MTWIGRFDKQHNPRLNFAIVRQSDGAKMNFDGIIDTGFTGFIQIPLPAAFTLGIVSEPIGFGIATLANGTEQRV